MRIRTMTVALLQAALLTACESAGAPDESRSSHIQATGGSGKA